MKNITILITAPENYAIRFKESLEHLNSRHTEVIQTISIPTIISATAVDHPSMLHLMNQIDQYDYMLFASRKAIDSMEEALSAHPHLRLSETTGYCAVGKDIDYMHQQLHVDPAFIPEEPSPMGIVQTLATHPDSMGKRIAVLVPEVMEIEEPPIVPQLLKALSDLGLIVDPIRAYTISPKENKSLATLIHEKLIDCIAFSSGSEIYSLLRILNAHQPPLTLPKSISIACFGPYTAHCAKLAGLKVDVVGKDFSSFDGFVEAIQNHFWNR